MIKKFIILKFNYQRTTKGAIVDVYGYINVYNNNFLKINYVTRIIRKRLSIQALPIFRG